MSVIVPHRDETPTAKPSRPEGHLATDDCAACKVYWTAAARYFLFDFRSYYRQMHSEQMGARMALGLPGTPFRFLGEGLSSGISFEEFVHALQRAWAEVEARGFRLEPGMPAEIVYGARLLAFETAALDARGHAGLEGYVTRPDTAELEILKRRGERLRHLSQMPGLTPLVADMARQLADLADQKFEAARRVLEAAPEPGRVVLA